MKTKTKVKETKVKEPKVKGTKGKITKEPARPIKPHKPSKRNSTTQFAYMRTPGLDHAFDVGDTVEVFCDHEKGSERVRGWLKGIVVQVDNKMAAVQFRTNVYLTDGWMVPDRILWYPVTSEHLRPLGTQKKLGNKTILEY
jgi:hypothetical protein